MPEPIPMRKTRGRFRVLLPSDPVRLPFHGSFEGLSFQADQDRVMGLDEHMDEIAGDLQEQIDEKRRAVRKRILEHTREWGEHQRESLARRVQTPEERAQLTTEEQLNALMRAEEYADALEQYTREMRGMNREIDALERQINLRILADTITRIGVPRVELDADTGDQITYWDWPFDESEPPDPRHADAFADWPDVVIRWMVNEGLEEVRGQLKNPTSGS